MNQVLTPDNQTVCSSSEIWRAWTEARHVVKIANIQDRQDYIATVRKIRGDKLANDLMDKVLYIWKLKKS